MSPGCRVLLMGCSEDGTLLLWSSSPNPYPQSNRVKIIRQAQLREILQDICPQILQTVEVMTNRKRLVETRRTVGTAKCHGALNWIPGKGG